jgi:hypothetical protein
MAIEAHITADDHVFIGEDKALVFNILQSDGKTPQDITGWTLGWMLKAHEDDLDADALLNKTTSTSITLTTPIAGICTVSLADTDTEPLSPGKYYHELKRTTSGFEGILAYGRFVLRRALHRS